MNGTTSRYPLTRSDLDFDLRPYLDLDLGSQKFKIAITWSFSSYEPEILNGSTSRYPLNRSDLDFDLRPYLDPDLGGQKFKIALTWSFFKL